MDNNSWAETFKSIYQIAEKRFQEGKQTPDALFTDEEAEFLSSIGASRQEIFDFVDDAAATGGDPSFTTVLLITAERRDYFFSEQNGKPSARQIDVASLPAKTDEIDGIRWLPRIIEKAKAKLRGEMPEELMYGCGGDRPFCRENNLHLADLLAVVRRNWDATDAIVDYVKRQRAN